MLIRFLKLSLSASLFCLFGWNAFAQPDAGTFEQKLKKQIENEQKGEKSKEEIGKRHENVASSLGQVKEKSYKRPAR